MRDVIISDTSCLIILSNIGELSLLEKIYGKVITTKEIAFEFGDKLPDWISVREVTDKLRQQILELQIDRGESSAIALALEIKNCRIILDDYKARKIATQLGLTITGTLGIIIKAKLIGIIPSIKPILLKIKETDFRISEQLELIALKESGE